MRFTDIPLQCRGCSSLEVNIKAKAKFKIEALKKCIIFNHIEYVPQVEIEGMPEIFNVKVYSVNSCVTTGGRGFHGGSVELLSVGEVDDFRCWKLSCVITKIFTMDQKGIVLDPLLNISGNCGRYDASHNVFDVFQK